MFFFKQKTAYAMRISDWSSDVCSSDLFAASCRQGRALGFDGKSLIHPKTLAVANGIFGPSSEEIAWARRIAAAHAAALAEGRAVVLVDGKQIGRAHV